MAPDTRYQYIKQYILLLDKLQCITVLYTNHSMEVVHSASCLRSATYLRVEKQQNGVASDKTNTTAVYPVLPEYVRTAFFMYVFVGSEVPFNCQTRTVMYE